MKLSGLCDEDLQKIALMKTRKGTATSEAKRAQQILYTRNISHGGFGSGSQGLTTLEMNITRNYITKGENHYGRSNKSKQNH